jgi:hypothetical protein
MRLIRNALVTLQFVGENLVYDLLTYHQNEEKNIYG